MLRFQKIFDFYAKQSQVWLFLISQENSKAAAFVYLRLALV
jgi:hypothetical protein